MLLDRVAAGGEIYVRPGRYASAYWTDRDFILIGSGQGDNPATSTILEGIDTRRVLITDFNVTSVIENFSIARGSVANGGGVTNNGTMSLRRVTVTGHQLTGSTASGAGVRQSSEATGSLTLTDCTVANNRHSSYGGGLAQASPTQPVTLTNCVVSGNRAGLSGTGDGGGICCLDGTVRVTGGSITNNQAVAGGGIWAASGGRGNVIVDGVSFSGNTPGNCVNVVGCPA